MLIRLKTYFFERLIEFQFKEPNAEAKCEPGVHPEPHTKKEKRKKTYREEYNKSLSPLQNKLKKHQSPRLVALNHHNPIRIVSC